MTNLDIQLLRRCLLTGSGAEAIGELLSNVKVEELVLKLSHMDDDCFVCCDEDEISVIPVVDDRYIGTLLVRVLDLVLDKSRLECLFQNSQVLDLLSQRVVTGRLPVRRLFARKCKLYFQYHGEADGRLEEVLWHLLFDPDYGVFESCSQAICAIVQRRDAFVTRSRVNTLVAKLGPTDDPDCVLPMRLFEFCVSLGRSSRAVFAILLDAGVYRALFSLYMSSDFLVKLNCLEILESSPELLLQLQQASSIPQEFVTHALSVFDSAVPGSSDELLVPFLFRIFVSMLRNGQLRAGECKSFNRFVSRILMSTSPHRSDASFCTALGCFGMLYLLGCLSEDVCKRLDEIVKSTTQEDVLCAVLDSLTCICEVTLNGTQLEFLVAITASVVKALPRFAMSEVREQAYTYLLKSISFDAVLQLVMEEESSSHLFTSVENLYATTVAKKDLVRGVLRRIDAVYGDSKPPLSEERLEALKKYAM